MFDRQATALIRPAVTWLARHLAGAGVGANALTFVGFGLGGHLLEMCRGSGLSARVQLAQMPLIPSAVAFAQQGIATGASTRNWAAYGHEVQWPGSAPEWQRALLTDPQTSGGLLVACAPDTVDAVLAIFRAEGFGDAAVVGEIVASSTTPRLVVA